jgi:hypothetical protein
MDRRTAKEYLHIRDWLEIAQRIVGKGEAAYLEDPVLQEAMPSRIATGSFTSTTRSTGPSPGPR